jgi:hypothetical protein
VTGLQPGERVRFSAFGIKWLGYRPEKAARQGSVIGLARDLRNVRVLWDGTRYPQTYSQRFIERVQTREVAIEVPQRRDAEMAV